MKNIYTKSMALAFLAMSSTNFLNAQCATTSNISSANNMFGLVRNLSNPVVVDKDLNTIVFVHRHNTNIFGGNSGNLRYDISTDAGSTWTSDLGPLNPASTNPQARYPNGLIYNPPSNTNTSNAYIGYLAPTTNTTNGSWSVLTTGGRYLSGSNNTELYNQPNPPSNLIAGSVVKGAPGVFWALDQTSSGGNYTGSFLIYKGVWNSSTNDINWSLNTTISPPYNPNVSFLPQGEFYIAFDPTGNIGWIGMMADATNNTNYTYFPVFYKTSNGGVTWSGPITVDLATINCLYNNTVYYPGAHSECNLVVDALGNPHLLGIFGEVDFNVYGIDESVWHTAMDITFNGTSWIGLDVSGVNASETSVTANPSSIFYNIKPQIARSADGNKIFYTWTDNSNYFVGSPNTNPNFFGKAYDVQQMKWTAIKDFSSCNPNTAGKIYFPHVAKDVLEPSAGVYKLAPFYGEFTSTLNADAPANYKFLDNCTFAATDFSITQTSSLNLNVLPGNDILLCQGNSVNLQLSGAFSQVLWSTGSQNNNIFVNTPGSYWVMASSGCSTGNANITVSNLVFNVFTNTLNICSGATVSLSTTGNAFGYTWTPGNLTGSMVVVSPIANTNYVVTAGGSGCSMTSALSLTVNPSPNILAVSNHSRSCVGDEVIIQATGAPIFVWGNTEIGSSITVYPTDNTIYTVIGTNTLGCSTTFTLEQLVDDCTGIHSNLVSKKKLSVYPNPNNGTFDVLGVNGIQLSIINEMGQLVKTIKTENNKISVADLASGIYFIVGDDNGQVIRQKIIVEK